MIWLIKGDDASSIMPQSDFANKGAAHWIAKKGAPWREAVDADFTAHGQWMGERGEQHSMVTQQLAQDDPRRALVAAAIESGFKAPGGAVATANAMLAAIRTKLITGTPLTEPEADYLVGRI